MYGTEHSVFLIALRLSFDGILGGMFWSLTGGHTLVLPDPRQLVRVAEFTRLAREHRVTHLFNIPSYYRAVLRDPGGLPDTLRLVVVGGEACTPQLVATHNERLPRTRIVNEYGPTETTIACTVETAPDPARERIPIGRPWPGARTLVLDERLREVPAGERGELYIGGQLVALGYANQPPARPSGSSRTRTGDRAGASTAPGTSPASTSGARCTTTAERTTRSRSAVRGSNSARSRTCWNAMRTWRRPWCCANVPGRTSRR
ncbi:hypothetical protein GCM10020295_35610 [Streptomyces cinereospinus]